MLSSKPLYAIIYHFERRLLPAKGSGCDYEKGEKEGYQDAKVKGKRMDAGGVEHELPQHIAQVGRW